MLFFDDIIKIEGFDKKQYEYNIGWKSKWKFWFMTIHTKFWLVQTHCVLGSIRVFDGNKYLVLLGSEKYDTIYDRIRYLISVKSGITYVISYNYARIKIDSHEKILTLDIVIIFIKPK